jgi:hypothetical protein
MSARPLSPIYGSDLRRLVNRAFGPAGLIPASPVPGGTLAARLHAARPASGPRVGLDGGGSEGADTDGTVLLPIHRYWVRALPHRLLIHGPLLELASSDVPPAERARAERLLVRVYRERYLGVPLPVEVLDLLDACAVSRGGADFTRWLDVARVRIMTAGALEQSIAARTALRRQVLGYGARNEWPEPTVAAAELMTDILVLCHASSLDLERATESAGAIRGSIAMAMDAHEDAQALIMESALPHLLRPGFDEAALDESDRSLFMSFAGSRAHPGRQLLALPESPATPPRTPVTVTRAHAVADRPLELREPQRQHDARADYHALIEELERRIIGSHMRSVVRHLALIGVGHLRGLVRQRVLLVGQTGAGKTHAAIALAESLRQPHLVVDTTDITCTGWVGGEVSAVLESLGDLTRSSGAGGVLVLDEADKARADYGSTGSTREAKVTLMHSLLALLAGQHVATNSGRDQIDTSRVLVIGTGSFGGRYRTAAPTTEDLVRWGWIPEFAARWGERLCVPPPGRDQAIELLARSDRSVERALGPLAAALGLQLSVPREVLAYATDAWLRGEADFRSAAEWLLSAARRRMVAAMETDGEATIVLAPDDLDMARATTAEERGGDEEGVTA